MPKGRERKDLTGVRFGKWLVLGYYGVIVTPGGQRKSHWLCRCDCGTTQPVYSSSLKTGKSTCCGCFSRKRLPKGIGARNNIICTYKGKCRRKGIAFELSTEEFEKLMQSNCYYCGKAPSNRHGNGKFNGIYVYSGVDRIDNSLGYTTSNTVPACKYCNKAKNNLSLIDFLEMVRRIYEKHIKAA